VERVHRVGVLFVHGIGTQPRGSTLADWGGALTSWIDRWTAPPGSGARPAITVGDAVLTGDTPAEPAHAIVALDGPAGDPDPRTILLAESWWAETILPPTYRDLLRWSLVVVPWTIGSHFHARLQRTTRSLLHASWHLLTLLAALLLMPLLLAALALVLLLALIPWAPVRAAAAAIQRALANTIGDSFVLLHNDIQRAAILTRVRRDLRWLADRSDQTVIVAHSQGAAVAYLVLTDTKVENVTLVTFGPGIAKLLEAQRLMRGNLPGRAGPWILCLTAALIAVGLWLGLPSLWTMRAEVLRAGAIFLAAAVVASLVASKLPSWLQITLGVVLPIPLLYVLWRWMDASSAPFPLMAAMFLIGSGLTRMTAQPATRPDANAAATWRDFYASRDPVSNGPLFEAGTPDAGTGPAQTSDEVWIQRSLVADHTGYWTSTDDFVARMACLIAQKAGVPLERWRADDGPRLRLARQRRRWRTAWLAAVRGGLLLSFFLIVATQGPSAPAEPSTPPAKPLGALHQQLTELIGELAGGVVPEAVQTRIADQPSTFATAPAVVAASSLVLLVLLIGSAFLLMAWVWRAWDRAEVGRLFRRENVKALEPTFVVFLLASLTIFELVLLTAMGWLAELRLAEAGTLRAVGLDVLKLGGLAASPWLVRLAFFYVGEFQLAQTIRRAAAAAAVAALAALPVLVWTAITPLRPPLPDAALTLIDRAPWFFLAVPPLILTVALSGVWRRYLEPRLAPHVFTGEPRAT
jgi:hypothetical protein